MAAITTRPGAVEVTSVASTYPTDPQVTLATPCRQITVVIMETDGAKDLSVSFDGTNFSGRLVPGILQGNTWDHTAGTKIWFKGTGTPTVQVLVE